MKRAEHREQSRSQIMDAAARAIAENGYFGMSMRELAKATGKSLASFYNYFPSKEDVLFSLQSEAFQALITSLKESLVGVKDPVERLHVLVQNHVTYFVEHPDLMRVLVQEAGALPPARRRAVRLLKERYFAIGREIMGTLMKQGCSTPGTNPSHAPTKVEIERAAYSVFGMLNWVYGWYEPKRHGTPQELARTIHGLALCGLMTRCPFRTVQNAVEEWHDNAGRLALVRTPA